VFKLAEQWLAEKGVKLLGISMSFLRGFINSAHEVRVPSDCRDLKIRSYEDQLVTTFCRLGHNLRHFMGEMFSALADQYGGRHGNPPHGLLRAAFV
jgi:TRAP-type C4-dicarboxylate transport system substrate-binding protein